MIEVRRRRAARHHRLLKVRAQRVARIFKLSMPHVAKHQRRLLILHVWLHAADLRLNMSIRCQNVIPTVQVVIQEERRKRQA